MAISDSYMFMLENKAEREFSRLGENINYISDSFDKNAYELSRSVKFPTREEAYYDWLKFGRSEGLNYTEEKDTLLKIILKVKDEPYLLEKWIK